MIGIAKLRLLIPGLQRRRSKFARASLERAEAICFPRRGAGATHIPNLAEVAFLNTRFTHSLWLALIFHSFAWVQVATRAARIPSRSFGTYIPAVFGSGAGPMKLPWIPQQPVLLACAPHQSFISPAVFGGTNTVKRKQHDRE